MSRMTLATATSSIGFVTCNADPTTKYIIAADVDSSRTISAIRHIDANAWRIKPKSRYLNSTTRTPNGIIGTLSNIIGTLNQRYPCPYVRANAWSIKPKNRYKVPIM